MAPKYNRTVKCIDIENMVGGSQFVSERYAAIKDQIWNFNSPAPHMLYVASGPTAIRNNPMLWDWADARWIEGHGIDGAEIALCERILNDPIVRNSSHLLLCSGDHYFCDIVDQLQFEGIDVTVMSRESALSRDLQHCARHLKIVPEFDDATLDNYRQAWSRGSAA
ncbi:MAG: hypothetical protein WCL17_05165 [Actinomycetota bacterium]|jgi:hypothetical protein